jgi:exodeoxyribonuclease-5
MIDLSSQQTAALHKIKEWHADAQGGFGANVLRLFGAAGTGKTTLAKMVPQALGLHGPDLDDLGDLAALSPMVARPVTPVVYGTYTGKAAHVLRSKGATPVSTIHSAIYFPTSSLEAKLALGVAQNELSDLEKTATELAELKDKEAQLALVTDLGWATVTEFLSELDETRERITELEAACRRVSWEFNPDGPWASASLIIVDEVSMVDAKVAQDVESYGVPILVLGDPAQLPPVEGGGYWTEARPDVLLTEIHRTALDNPITALATRIRESTGSSLGITAADMRPASIREAMEYDQVITWTNKRRWALINAIRRLKGFPEGVPVAGDRVMCLTNNKDLAVFNGEQFTVQHVDQATLGPTLTMLDDQGDTRQIPTFADGFLGRDMQDQAKKSGAGRNGGRMLATFAQAITAHKAQGSECDRVYVVNELDNMISMNRKKPGDPYADARRWLYTAVTRAKSEVVITAPRPN